MDRYKMLKESFGERDSDVYVSTFSRSGTTWMQLIMYQLTTDGDMSFNHLFDVAPWVFINAVTGTPVPEVPEPRVRKTHDNYSLYPKGTKGRFIHVIRDGKDVCVSYYHHKRAAKGFRGSFDEHFDSFLDTSSEYNWFNHTKEWLSNENQLNILYVSYEALRTNFDAEIQRVADFCGISLTDELLARVKQFTSFEYMKQHQDKFGPTTKFFAGKVGSGDYKGLPETCTQFIRNGKVGEGEAVFSEEHKMRYEAKFQALLGEYSSRFAAVFH